MTEGGKDRFADLVTMSANGDRVGRVSVEGIEAIDVADAQPDLDLRYVVAAGRHEDDRVAVGIVEAPPAADNRLDAMIRLS